MKKILILLFGSLVIITALSVVIHEAGHYLAGLGFYHVSGSITFFQGWAIGQYSAPDYGNLVYYAGGLFAALVLGILYLIIRNWPFEVRVVLLLTVLLQFIYGIFEGISVQYPAVNLTITGWYFLVVGLSIGFCLFANRELKILEVDYAKSSV